MKKSIILIAISVAMCLATTAQERTIRVYSNGQAVYDVSTSGTNTVSFNGSNAQFTHNSTTWTTSIASIDSLVFATNGSVLNFDTVVVDTATAVHITWNGDTAYVDNPFESDGVTVDVAGADVTVNSTSSQSDIPYILCGTSSNGSLSITTSKKVLVCLENLTLTSTTGTPIKMVSDKRMALNLGGINTILDSDANGGKGAIQAKGKLEIQGSGTLNVTGMAKHGIQSSGKFSMYGGTVNILGAVKDGMNVDCFSIYRGSLNVTNANGDGIDGDQGFVEILGGTVNVNCSADDVKGIGCDSTLTISGGTVTVTVTGQQSKGIKCKQEVCINGGATTIFPNGTLYLESMGSGFDPSYCTGIKADAFSMSRGELIIQCANTNAGGKCISTDHNVNISGGILELTSTGACSTYVDTAGVNDSYSSACISADGDIIISGGSVTAVAGGRGLNCDGSYTQSGGSVNVSTNASGFGTILATGSYYSDGFAPACLKADGDITFIAGSFNGGSTGKAGRGIRGKGKMTVGHLGADDNLLNIFVTTSGAPFSSTENSDYWKGLPKGVKIEGNITVNSGHLQSYCSQSGGNSSSNSTAANGFCLKTAGGTEVMTFKYPTVNGNGFESYMPEALYNGPKPPPGGGDGPGGSSNGEGIETKDSLFINGGYVESNALDDAINAANYIGITGGHVWAHARNNDGLDCNGTRIDVSGGVLICRGTEVAIDDNGDRGGRLYISGGTVILVGGSMQQGTTETTPAVTNQSSLTIGGSGWGPSSSRVYISSPDIQSGSYRWYASPSISGGTSWHGLYSGATVTTGGNGTSVTAQ